MMNSAQIVAACMPEALKATAERGLNFCDEVAHKDIEHVCLFIKAEGEVAFIFDFYGGNLDEFADKDLKCLRLCVEAEGEPAFTRFHAALLKVKMSELFVPNILYELATALQQKLMLSGLSQDQ